MNSISLPEVNITLNSVATPSVGDRRVLICGQLGVTVADPSDIAATATSGTPVKDVHLLPLSSIQSLFGANSMLAHSVVKFLDSSSRQCPLDVLPISAPTGGTTASAASTLALTGTASVAGTMRINVISKKDFTTTVSVAKDATAATVATAVAAALTALTEDAYAPFTATSDSGTVTITATDAGTIGNNYSISLEGVPAGLGFTLAGFATGAETPTLTTLFDNLEDIRYTGILAPRDWATAIQTFVDLTEARFNLTNVIQDGIVAMGYYDTAANLITLLGDKNNKTLVFLGNNKASGTNTLVKGGAITHYEDLLAAEFLAYRDTRLTTGANVASMVSTNAPLDQIGGMSLASLPYFNTPLHGVPQPNDLVSMFSSAEMDALGAAGYTVVGKNVNNTGMLLGFTVTAYKTNVNGTADNTFKYLNYVDTASMIREYIFNSLKADFAQTRLTTGGLPAGRAFTNAQLIKSSVRVYLSRLSDSEDFGSLVQGGTEAEQFINKHLNVSVNFVNRSATISAQVPIVGQLGTINFPITITTTLS